MQSLTHALIKLLPGVGASTRLHYRPAPTDTLTIQTTSITSGRAIPALSALYLFWTFGASGAISAAGQAMGRAEGLDNDHPRKHVGKLDGLPLRLRSAHYALMENFPGKHISHLIRYYRSFQSLTSFQHSPSLPPLRRSSPLLIRKSSTYSASTSWRSFWCIILLMSVM